MGAELEEGTPGKLDLVLAWYRAPEQLVRSHQAISGHYSPVRANHASKIHRFPHAMIRFLDLGS